MPSDAHPATPVDLRRDTKLLESADARVYKSTPQGELKIHFFFPENYRPENTHPVVLFLHGGLWDQPLSSQLVPQALNFAAHGAIGAVVEYRTRDPHGTTPLEAIEDAQDAILWLRQHHTELGANPTKIVLGGAGSGAHLALCCGMHKKIAKDVDFDSRPNALLLFSAIIDTTKKGVGHDLFPSKRDARRTSPSKHIRRKLPPMLFFHGNEDAIVPVASIERFCQKLSTKRNVARFVPFARATHSFFNFNVNQHYFIQTLESAEGFLASLEILELPDSNLSSEDSSHE